MFNERKEKRKQKSTVVRVAVAPGIVEVVCARAVDFDSIDRTTFNVVFHPLIISRAARTPLL